MEEDGTEQILHAPVHLRCQTGRILQGCYHSFFLLWIVEGNLAGELIDNGIKQILVSREFLGSQLRCASILAVLCSSSSGSSGRFLDLAWILAHEPLEDCLIEILHR